MMILEFYHQGEKLGSYSVKGTDHRDIIHQLFDLSDDFNVPRDEIEIKYRDLKGERR